MSNHIQINATIVLTQSKHNATIVAERGDLMLYPKSEEIKRRREKMQISQRKLCELAGLPNNAIYRIETKESSYTFPIRARAIAKALKCKVADIFEEV